MLFTVAETTPEQADAAIAEAAQAFTTWRTTPAPVRGALVARLGELLVEHKDDLAALVTIEAGKITSEALGEVQEMIDICEFAVGLSRQLYGKTIASERPGHRLMETWHPLGVVGVITAFNFPVAVWSWNAAIALVCGDTLVWKPSELTPLTALACQALAERAADDVGAPRAVSRLIQGGREVGERLVDDPRVALLSATGSVRMGQQVGPRVAQRFGRVLLELGGNNAAIVTPSADLELAVRGIVFSAAGTAGQRCTTLRRLIVHRSIADNLVERIVSAYRQLPIGDPASDGTLVGPLIHETAYRDMVGALERARAEGGEVFGGERHDLGENCVLRRPGRGADARADRAGAPRDVRADPLRAHLRRARRGDRAEQRCAAGSFVGDLHPRHARGRALHGGRRLRLRHRQRQHRHVGRRDRRGVRRRKADRRRPRVRVGCVEGLHAQGDQHRQLLIRAAAGAGRALRLTRKGVLMRHRPVTPRPCNTAIRVYLPWSESWRQRRPRSAMLVREAALQPGSWAAAAIPDDPSSPVFGGERAAHYGVLASSVIAVVVAAGLLVLRVVPGRAEGISIHREAQHQ